MLIPINKLPRLRYSGINEFCCVARLVAPRFGGAAINRFNIGADRFFASTIGTGSISILAYTYQLVQASIGLLFAAFGKTLMPALSRQVVRNGPESLRELIPKCIGFAGFALPPLVIFFAFFSEPIIRILFQHGAFDLQATHLAAEVAFFYSIGAFFSGFCMILQGAFYALRDTLTPFKVNLMALGLNIILDIILMKLIGLPGIALGSAIVALCSMIYLYFILRDKIGVMDNGKVIRSFLKIIPVTIVLGIVGWANKGWMMLFLASESIGMQIFSVTFIFILFVGFYLFVCRGLRVEEYLYIARFFGKGLRWTKY